MMLTGRRLSAQDGQRLGISHEIVATDELEARAVPLSIWNNGKVCEIAPRIAANAPVTNQLILTALPRVSDMSQGYGLWAEALTTALTQSTAAQEGSKRSSRSVRPSSAATELVSPTAVRSGYSPGSSE